MFTESELIISQEKLVFVNLNAVTLVANQRVYFPTDGFLSSKRITALRVNTQELPTGAFNAGNGLFTTSPANLFVITLIEFGTGKILIENSPLTAFVTLSTPRQPIKRLNNLHISFQDSFITFIQPGVGVSGTGFSFSFYYQ